MSRPSNSKTDPKPELVPAPTPFIRTDLFATLVASGIYLSVLAILVVSILS